MFIASCPLRVSLFGGPTDNPYFVEKYGYGSVISFTCDLKTYVTISQDKFGFNRDHKYIINYSRREEVSEIKDIQNEVVRVVLEHFNMPPCQVTLTSDAYSQGSGLASSSSYLISLIKSCSMFLNINLSETEICALAYTLELKFNPYCGYQDPYGCGVGGFKRIEFLRDGTVRFEYLHDSVLGFHDLHLVFTGVTRNSKVVLKGITENLDKVKPLLETVKHAYDAIKFNEHDEFLYLIGEGWEKKKKTCDLITENKHIREMDEELTEEPTVLAHRLCGAGNGGFFLTFSEKDSLRIPYDNVKINLVSDGVRGESI